MTELDRDDNLRIIQGHHCKACGVILEDEADYDEHFQRVHIGDGVDDQDDDQTELEFETEPEEPEPDEEE